jgi:DNA-binding protein H-NS
VTARLNSLFASTNKADKDVRFPLEINKMPRPANLSSMSIDALVKLREDINKILDRKANELRSQLSMLDGGAPHFQGKASLKGKKVPPKYRGPGGVTWAGRGARPRWLVAAIKRGKKIDDFLIDKSARKRRS